MTSTQSVNKRKNPTFIWFKQQVSKSMVFGILIIILMFFVNLLQINELTNYAYGKDSAIDFASQTAYISDVYMSIMFLCYLLVFAVLVKNFRHLYKKSIADTVYALPISNNQRFIGSLLASLAMIVVPMLISILLTIAYYTASTGASQYFDEMLKNSKITDSDFIWVFANLGFAQLANMLFMFGAALFVFCCCGEFFDSIVYTGVFSAIALVIYYVFYSITQGACGNYYWSYGDVPMILHYLSPFSPLMMYSYEQILTPYFYDYYGEPPTGNEIARDEFISYYLIIFAIALVLIALSFLLHSKRKSEHVGQTFAYKPFYYIITSIAFLVAGVGFFMAYLSTQTPYDRTYYHGVMITVLLVSFFAFLVVEVIAERKKRPTRKRIIQGAVRFTAVFVVGIAISAVGSKIGIKNAYDKPIKTDDVTSVYLSINVWENGAEYDDYGYPIFTNEIMQSALVNGASFTDEEAIAKLGTVCDRFNEMIYNKYKNEGHEALFGDYSYEYEYMESLQDGDIIFNGISIEFTYEDGSAKHYFYDNSVSDDVEAWVYEALEDELLLSKIVSYEEYYR